MMPTTLKSKPMLDLDAVKRIAGAAEAEARQQGFAVSIAIVDDGGHLLWLERLDGAAPISAHIAPAKARTAALGRRESRLYEEMINQGRVSFLSAPDLHGMLEGGVPIVVDGQCVGAVGVSGVKSSEDAQVARAGIAAQTADSWFSAKGLAIQLADARETARIQQSLYDVTTKRAQVGIAATSDADRVAGDLAQAKSQIATLEAEIQVQKRLLLILAGRIVEPTANIAVTPSVGLIPAVPAGLPSDLLARRPDVREAQARIDAQLGRLQAARLAILPTLLFTPGIGWSKIEQPGFSSTTQSHTIGGSVTQPVLSIPRLLADAKAQGARTEQAVIAYEKTVQTAFSDSEGALVRLDADRRRVAILTDGEARARRAFEASRIGYDRGLTDLQTTLSVEQSWRQTRTQLTSAQVQALRGAVTAYKALGGGWPAEKYITQAQAR
jgi:outer membrane protein TolC